MAIDLIRSINPEASYDAIAKILKRRKASIVHHVTATRDMFRFAAPQYLELHMEAASIAAKQGNALPAQWALDRIAVKDDDGNEIRVTEAPAQRYDTGAAGRDGGLTINVGIALSQVAPTVQQATPASVPLLLEGEALPASDSSDKT